jgi:transcriptional regulator with XRE-family HTH domain
VHNELEHERPLFAEIAELLGLSHKELAELLGVSRQALEQWGQRGVPAERQEKLAMLGEISDLLAAKLKHKRIPGVVRRPADVYGGRSIIEAIADDKQGLVLKQLREAFDWAATA